MKWSNPDFYDPVAAEAAHDYDPYEAEREGPTRAEARRESIDDGHGDLYTGSCGGCGRFVSPSVAGGSCIEPTPDRGLTVGPWHPGCRDAALAARDDGRVAA